MTQTTQNLGLVKTDMETDGEDLFDFDRDLNENWDKIDLQVAKKEDLNNKANKDLSNLSDTGNDYINQSKALETGNVSSNSDVYADVLSYAHSTFDLSKFTVVGSPTITDEGVASGFSTSNYITFPNLGLENANTWFIRVLTQLGQEAITPGAVLSTESGNGFMLIFHDEVAELYLSSSESEWDISHGNRTTVGATGDWCLSELEFTGTQYIWKMTNITTGNIYQENINNTSKIYQSPTRIGIKRTTNPYTGSIDLKSISIWSDGVPIFNGNKTGLDIIKDNNYTTVGAPVITEDGIVTNLIKDTERVNLVSTDILSGKSWSIRNKVYWQGRNNGVSNEIKIGDSASYLKITTSNELTFNAYLKSNNTQVYMLKYYPSIFDTAGWYYVRIDFDYNTGTYSMFASKTPNEWTKLNEVVKGAGAELRLLDSSHFIYLNNPNSNRSDTLNDLNENKVYVEDSLVYQPCLKIPYTLSKTGSKIVDVAYRDRVQDLYEQEGTALYYTIDEQNQNFTLPMGEVYGMIERGTKYAFIGSQYEDFTPGTTGTTYTAPEDGYFYATFQTTKKDSLELFAFSVIDEDNQEMYSVSYPLNSTYLPAAAGLLTPPIKKGTKVSITLSINMIFTNIRFYYANGVKKETND